jgi:hypothetical protein
MTRKERTTVTIETHQVTVVSTGRRPRQEWCPECRKRVPMVSAEHAAALLGVTPGSIYRRVEIGALHFMEQESGMLICVASLGGAA